MMKCVGFARTYKLLANAVGLKCGFRENGAHMWNGVYIDGEAKAILKSPKLAADTRGALEQFFNQTQEKVEGVSVPSFALKYRSRAPVHQIKENGDGTYSITLEFSEGYDWRQSGLVYDLPEGWTFQIEDGKVTFHCTTGNPDIGLIKGHFPEGSNAAKYWIKPNTFKIWFSDGWDESSAVEGKQAMITMTGEQQTWEVWLSFGKGDNPKPTPGEGSYEIPYTQYLHEETFKRDYKIELEKQCDETGKTLEDSTFEVLEQFDFSQLDGTNLEGEQFRRNTREQAALKRAKLKERKQRAHRLIERGTILEAAINEIEPATNFTNEQIEKIVYFAIVDPRTVQFLSELED